MRDAKKIRFYAQAEVERLEKLVSAVDLSKWQEWKKGDIVESLESEEDIHAGWYYTLTEDTDEDGNVYFVDSDGCDRNRDADKYRFYCRPMSTAP
jgi:hypothetical protein